MLILTSFAYKQMYKLPVCDTNTQPVRMETRPGRFLKMSYVLRQTKTVDPARVQWAGGLRYTLP